MAYDTDVRHVIRQPMTKENYLTLTQASNYTGFSRRTLQRYVASGKLPSTKNANGVRQIPVLALKQYAKAERLSERAGDEQMLQILLEILELIPLSDIAAISKKQRLREMINQLGGSHL